MFRLPFQGKVRVIQRFLASFLCFCCFPSRPFSRNCFPPYQTMKPKATSLHTSSNPSLLNVSSYNCRTKFHETNKVLWNHLNLSLTIAIFLMQNCSIKQIKVRERKGQHWQRAVIVSCIFFRVAIAFHLIKEIAVKWPSATVMRA